MVSERKSSANQRNSKLSRGPRDTSKTRFNALKHGMLSGHVLIACGDGKEDEEEFGLFAEAIMSDLAPAGAVEELLVGDLIVIAWRKRRVVAYESAVLSKQSATTRTDYAQQHPISKTLRANLPRKLVEEMNGTALLKRQTGESETPRQGAEKPDYTDAALERFPGLKNSQSQLPQGSDLDLSQFISPIRVLATWVAVTRAPLLELIKDDSPDLTNALVQITVRAYAAGMGVPVNKILDSEIKLEKGQTYPLEQVEQVIEAACKLRDISQDEFWAEVNENVLKAWEGAKNELISYALDEDREIELAGLPDDSSLAKIQRYEAHLSRIFYRALHELQRLQAARHGLRPPAPLAVDL